MFRERIETSPIPERVFELCRIIRDTPDRSDVIREKLEPAHINTKTLYFASILNAAMELRLVEESDDHLLSYCGDEKTLGSMEFFRKYCNSVVFQNQETVFYKVAACFLNADLRWLKYDSLTSQEVFDDIRKNTDMTLVHKDMLLGMRFWMSFLGFGLIHEVTKISFLPNMYVALKDFMQMAELEKDREYTARELTEQLMPYASVALDGALQKQSLNYAMSSALRMLHDKKEIWIHRNQDSQEVWNLYPMEGHDIVSEFTHITIKKEVK